MTRDIIRDGNIKKHEKKKLKTLENLRRIKNVWKSSKMRVKVKKPGKQKQTFRTCSINSRSKMEKILHRANGSFLKEQPNNFPLSSP